MRKLAWIAAALFATILAGTVLVSVILAEGTLHIQLRPAPSPVRAGRLAAATGSTWSDARITARDGVALDGWLFQPPQIDGDVVILLHGVGDSRTGMLEHAQVFLEAGYSVLTPDVRGHGASGGATTSYGLAEAADVHEWAEWLIAQRGARRLYGLGESMGAAILLQSLACEPRFRSIVAECAFATFESVAYDRLAQASGIRFPFTWPFVQLGLVYSRVFYGLNLRSVSPLDAVRATTTPVLLIHGLLDVNIPPSHSRVLHAANPKATRLWEVPGAMHVAALATRPGLYRRTVINWFQTHP